MTCDIRCNSPETLRHSQELARQRIRLDRIIEKTFRSFPGGVEKRIHKEYRLGDYFDSIELTDADSRGESPSFKVIFHVHGSVDSFWKDLVVTVLRSISDEAGASLGHISQST